MSREILLDADPGPAPAALAVGSDEREHTPLKHYSLRNSLFVLVVVCVLPAVAVSSYLVYSNYQLRKQKTYGDTVLLAHKISAALDRELSAIESGLRVLSTAESLRDGDLRRFHRITRDALKSQIVHNYLLTDREGRQVVNTLLPFGEALPTTGMPPELDAVFRTGNTVLTDMFTGPLTNRPVLAMGVPVRRDEAIIYSLNIGLSPNRLNEILARQELPEGWLVAILDRAGTIVGRSRDAERFVGQKAVPELLERVLYQPQGSQEVLTKEGIPVVTSFVRSPAWGWSVVIGAPKGVLEGGLYRMLTALLIMALVLFVIGTWLAATLANRVLSSVQQLNDAALALGGDQPVTLPAIQWREAEAVGLAIVEASRLMGEVKYRAYHDPLTGLANRAFFYELLLHQIATAEREIGSLAVLAIDLDNFKTVNDEAGHPAGDALLKVVAERITQTMRAADVAARMGGDEFSILLWNADHADAEDTAQRLRLALEKPYPGVSTQVSASIGIAVYPAAGTSLDALLENADQALYKAKRAGKNAFVHFSPALESGATAE